jgi:flagellin-like protein
MENKRGISQIVTTVLIILIILVAIVLIWNFVRPAITKAGEQISTDTDCLRLDIEVINCVVSSDSVNVTVKRNAGIGDFQGMRIVLSDGRIVDEGILGELESEIFTIENSGEIFSVNVAALVGENLRACNPQHSPRACT